MMEVRCVAFVSLSESLVVVRVEEVLSRSAKFEESVE